MKVVQPNFPSAYCGGISADGSLTAVETPKDASDAPENSVSLGDLHTVLSRLNTQTEVARVLAFSPDKRIQRRILVTPVPSER